MTISTAKAPGLLRSPFFWRLFLPYLTLICVVTGVVGFVGVRQLRNSYLERTQQSLQSQTALVGQIVAPRLMGETLSGVAELAGQIGRDSACRVTIIRADGVVLADNEAQPNTMDNHRLRPEIVLAATQGVGWSIRPSTTIHADLLYFARRIDVGGKPYYVRLAVHLKALDEHLWMLYGGLTAASVIAIVVGGSLCFNIARRRAKPIMELTAFADAIAHGQLGRRVLLSGRDEMSLLANALNAMADSLRDMLSQIGRDQAQIMAILADMSEGVIATDTQQKLLLANNAAARLLGVAAPLPHGKFLWEIARSEPIVKAAMEVLQTGERKVVQTGLIDGRHLEATLCIFSSSEKAEGLLLVMHDITQIMRYQELRKEFVANVSHELRTPLSVIRGYVETLRDGALADPQRATQYLGTIQKHAEQLNNLVTDLLEISKLEGHPGLGGRAPVDVPGIVRKAAELLQGAARVKQQELTVNFEGDIPKVMGNADYLERAVSNLLDNAVKYTPNAGKIGVRVKGDRDHVLIEVSDNGIGITAADLPRIFERFYRVDRSRSRDMGGTGLGLAIVKHIVQAHGGTAAVLSTVGTGSVFTISLPAASEA